MAPDLGPLKMFVNDFFFNFLRNVLMPLVYVYIYI